MENDRGNFILTLANERHLRAILGSMGFGVPRPCMSFFMQSIDRHLRGMSWSWIHNSKESNLYSCGRGEPRRRSKRSLLKHQGPPDRMLETASTVSNSARPNLFQALRKVPRRERTGGGKGEATGEGGGEAAARKKGKEREGGKP